MDKRHLLEKVGDNVSIGYIEFNEYGNLFNRVQMYDVIHQIEMLQNPIIVVYTHGWHHNSSIDDDNVSEFKETLKQINSFNIKTEPTSKHCSSESQPKDCKSRPLIGVYVDWRGESVDKNKAYPISLLTFWERKNTAHEVGNGGVEELFVRLSKIRYKDGNEKSKLVIIGHSFGGLITYTALHHHFVEELTKNDVNSLATPIADAVILINPAIEAIRFKSLFDIAWSNEKYERTARPMLTIVTSEADSATKTAFKIGRKISSLANAYATPEDQMMNITAIGHYKPFVTHTLLPIADKVNPHLCDAQNKHEVNQLIVQTSKEDSKFICFNEGKSVSEKAKFTVLTRCDELDDCKDLDPKFLIPKGKVSDGLVPYHVPILNIHTSAAVMSEHSDIWNPTMQQFLVKFVIASLKGNGPIPTSLLDEQ